VACGLQEVLQLLLNSKFRVKTREALGKNRAMERHSQT
jgi:hypothetical protein